MFHFLNSLLFFGGCSHTYISCAKSLSSLILSSLSSLPLLCLILGSFYRYVTKFADLFFFSVLSVLNLSVFFISDIVFPIVKSLIGFFCFFFKVSSMSLLGLLLKSFLVGNNCRFLGHCRDSMDGSYVPFIQFPRWLHLM